MSLFIHVFGSAAGGGFPQWNCSCPNCEGVRRGTISATARSQSSIGVSENGKDWILVNASPDVRTQLEAFEPVRPSRNIRETGISSIILMDSQIDHTTGLLSLREGLPLKIYCTEPVYKDLTIHHPILKTLQFYCQITREAIPVNGVPFFPEGVSGLEFTGIPTEGKAPPYSPNRHLPLLGDGLILKIRDRETGKTVTYAPNLGHFQRSLLEHLQDSDVLLIDGTFWENSELGDLGISEKTALSMGHVPLNGPEGLLNKLRELAKPRKILIHINNTNPILNENSRERKILEQEGIEVAYDGMDINLP